MPTETDRKKLSMVYAIKTDKSEIYPQGSKFYYTPKGDHFTLENIKDTNLFETDWTSGMHTLNDMFYGEDRITTNKEVFYKMLTGDFSFKEYKEKLMELFIPYNRSEISRLKDKEESHGLHEIEDILV